MTKTQKHTQILGLIPNAEVGPGREVGINPIHNEGSNLGHRATEGDYDTFGRVKDQPRGPLGQFENRLEEGTVPEASKGCADAIRTAPDGGIIWQINVEPLLDPLKLLKEGMGGINKN